MREKEPPPEAAGGRDLESTNITEQIDAAQAKKCEISGRGGSRMEDGKREGRYRDPGTWTKRWREGGRGREGMASQGENGPPVMRQ